MDMSADVKTYKVTFQSHARRYINDEHDTLVGSAQLADCSPSKCIENSAAISVVRREDRRNELLNNRTVNRFCAV